MTNWEEIPDTTKTWSNCQQFFEAVYFAQKRYMDAKGQKQEQTIKIIEDNIQMYLTTIEAKADQNAKEHGNNRRKLKTSSFRAKL